MKSRWNSSRWRNEEGVLARGAKGRRGCRECFGNGGEQAGSTTVRDEESSWKECWWEMRASSKRLLVLGVLAGHA